jgi:hypothetical protein
VERRSREIYPLVRTARVDIMIQSAEEFVRLRESSRPVDFGRAAREEATAQTWREVIDRYPHMRRWVAHNKTVPVDILALLAQDSDSQVRLAVAMKRKITPSILRELAVDQDDSIRLRVAMHHQTPRDVLERLTFDSWQRVREVAEQRLSEK